MSAAAMTKAIRLYLARHGQTAWNLERRLQGGTDVPLDDVGREQARSLADSLRGRISAVLASDMLRAQETARIVAGALQLPLLALDADLRERGNGVFEGLTHEECSARYPEVWAARAADRNVAPPGGEEHALILARMQRGLERSVALLSGRHADALIVGHGGSLRMFLELVSGHPQRRLANTEVREVLHDGTRFVLS